MNVNQRRNEVLFEIVGPKLYRIIVEKLGSCQIRISSRGDFYNLNERNRHIREDFYAKTDVKTLAEKYDLSEDRIRKIINEK